jgi:hypothetical protein
VLHVGLSKQNTVHKTGGWFTTHPQPEVSWKQKCKMTKWTASRNSNGAVNSGAISSDSNNNRTDLNNVSSFYILCGQVVRVPGYRSRGPGSTSGATRFFSEK